MNEYYKFYEGLRLIPPIRINESWLISRFDDVKNVLSKNNDFSIERVNLMFPSSILDNKKIFFAKYVLQTWIVHSDKKNSFIKTDLMNNITEFLSPSNLENLDISIEKLISENLDTKIDFKQNIAIPIMSQITIDLLNVKESQDIKKQYELIFKHAEIVSVLLEDVVLSESKALQFAESLLFLMKLGVNFDGTDEDFDMEEYNALNYTIYQIQQSLILGTLVYNTVNLLCNALDVLYNHNNIITLENLKSAIVESIRLESPVQAVLRIANEDSQISGQKILKGEPMTVIIGSANRDINSKYNDPNSFVLGRERTPLLSFGYGMHACIGQHLVLQVAQILFENILFKNRNISIESAEWDNTLRGYRSLNFINVIFS